MALTWDLTEIENAKELFWVDNPDPNKKEDETFMLNPVTTALIHTSMFTGISKITPKNYKELSKRLVELEMVGIAMIPYNSDTGEMNVLNLGKDPSFRNPTTEEVHQHIGLVTNVAIKETRKWNTEKSRLLREHAEEYINKRDGNYPYKEEK